MKADVYYPKEMQAVLAKQVPLPGPEHEGAGQELARWLTRWNLKYAVLPTAEVRIKMFEDSWIKAGPGDWIVLKEGEVHIMTDKAFNLKYERRLYPKWIGN